MEENLKSLARFIKRVKNNAWWTATFTVFISLFFFLVGFIFGTPSQIRTPVLEWLRQQQDIVLIITYLSLFLALWQILAARNQTKSLQRIQESLSTRYLGGLSDFYPVVIEKIKGAEEAIEVLCDFPAYGCFTNPDLWVDYRYVLSKKKANEKVRIELVCQDAEFRRRADVEFFKEAKDDWGEWLTKPAVRKRLSNFLDRMSYENKNIGELQLSTLYGLLRKADELTMKECFEREGGIREVEAIVRLDFWVFDGREAIFAFTNYAHGSSRAGFFTTDPRLINALRDIADSYPPTTH